MGLAHYNEYDGSRHQCQKESVSVRSASNASNYLEVSEHVVFLHPAESQELIIKVRGRPSCCTVLEVIGFPWHVAQCSLTSTRGVIPFTLSILVVAKPAAQPGVYPWSIVLRNADEGMFLDELQMSLVILPQALSKERYEKLKALYGSYGIQLALWIALRISYPLGASFSAVQRALRGSSGFAR